MEIIEENGYFINSGAIGDFSIKELEKEAIVRTLNFLIITEEKQLDHLVR